MLLLWCLLTVLIVRALALGEEYHGGFLVLQDLGDDSHVFAAVLQCALTFNVQGDLSGRLLAFVDMKLKVPF